MGIYDELRVRGRGGVEWRGRCVGPLWVRHQDSYAAALEVEPIQGDAGSFLIPLESVVAVEPLTPRPDLSVLERTLTAVISDPQQLALEDVHIDAFVHPHVVIEMSLRMRHNSCMPGTRPTSRPS